MFVLVKGTQSRDHHGRAKSWRRGLGVAGVEVLIHVMTSRVRFPSFVSFLLFYPSIEFPWEDAI